MTLTAEQTERELRACWESTRKHYGETTEQWGLERFKKNVESGSGCDFLAWSVHLARAEQAMADEAELRATLASTESMLNDATAEIALRGRAEKAERERDEAKGLMQNAFNKSMEYKAENATLTARVAELEALNAGMLKALNAVLHDCDNLDMIPSNEPGRDESAYDLVCAMLNATPTPLPVAEPRRMVCPNGKTCKDSECCSGPEPHIENGGCKCDPACTPVADVCVCGTKPYKTHKGCRSCVVPFEAIRFNPKCKGCNPGNDWRSWKRKEVKP